MNMRTQLRGLAAAAALAVGIISLPSGTAHAMPKQPVDNGVRCGYFIQVAGQWRFYLPGEAIYVHDANGKGHTLVCGDDGNWHETVSQVPGSTTNHVNPGTSVSQP